MALVKSLSWGMVAFVLRLAVYFGVVSLVSGLDFSSVSVVGNALRLNRMRL